MANGVWGFALTILGQVKIPLVPACGGEFCSCIQCGIFVRCYYKELFPTGTDCTVLSWGSMAGSTSPAILPQDKTVQSVPVGKVLYNNSGQKYHTEYKNRTHLHMQAQEEFLLVRVWLEQSPTLHLPLTCSIYLL